MENILTCPACSSVYTEIEETIDSFTGEGDSIVCWCIGRCMKCYRNFEFESVYKFAEYRNIELTEE